MKKERIHQELVNQLQTKIIQLKKQLADIEADRNSETKSSAGDKYETSREMMQREANQIETRLLQAQGLLDTLTHLPKSDGNTTVQVGHLLETNRGWLYLSIPFGKIIIHSHSCFALSPSSPIGTKLLGSQVGDQIPHGRITYIIEAIY
ncbi:MAG: 3-oxoacyl-ACP synthase [Saprospiraceae bacterium]|nr:3-oxoacyl-ACP synthase [Saprospiraceae bacterium]